MGSLSMGGRMVEWDTDVRLAMLSALHTHTKSTKPEKKKKKTRGKKSHKVEIGKQTTQNGLSNKNNNPSNVRYDGALRGSASKQQACCGCCGRGCRSWKHHSSKAPLVLGCFCGQTGFSKIKKTKKKTRIAHTKKEKGGGVS